MNKKLKRKNEEYRPPYPIDVQTLQNTLYRAGYDASLWDIAWAWSAVSEAACAGWLMVDTYSENDQIELLLNYLTVNEDGCDNCGC